MANQQMSQDMQRCIDECTACHQVCLRTIQHCLGMGGKHAEQAHVRVMADCAQICARQRGLHAPHVRPAPPHVRRVRRGVPAVRRRLRPGRRRQDQQMKQCADACRRCAESCRKMASSAA